MCRNSRISLKRISVLLLLFCLLVSPCFSAGRWSAITGLREKPLDLQNQGLVSQTELPKTQTVIVTESSPVKSTIQLETQKEETLEKLENLLLELKKESTSSENQSEEVIVMLTKLDSLLKSLEELETISDSIYSTENATLIEVLEANKKQADAIATLQKEAKTKAYAKLNAVIGFDNGIPNWGLGGSLGIRFGKNVMLEAGADYMFGDFVSLPSFKWDMDRLRVTTGIGWMF